MNPDSTTCSVPVEVLGAGFAAVHARMMASNPLSLGAGGGEDPVDLFEPDAVTGRCDEVTEQVQYAAHAVGLRPVPGRMRLTRADGTEHVVAVHRGHVIDYTLRQFDPGSAVPHVAPIQAYLRDGRWISARRD